MLSGFADLLNFISERNKLGNIFRLDALAKALSVIATATWLGGWLGVRHTPVLYQNG